MKIFQLIFLFLCLSSCASLDKYTVARINDLSKKPFETGKKYVFENSTYGYFTGDEFKILEKKKDNWAFWDEVEPKYVNKDSLIYTYKTSIELKSKNQIHFELIDSLGNIKREITKKYTRGDNYIKYSTSNNEFYFIFNRLDSSNIYMYLDDKDDLILTRDGGTTVFLFIMPFGGTNGSLTQKYKNIKD